MTAGWAPRKVGPYPRGAARSYPRGLGTPQGRTSPQGGGAVLPEGGEEVCSRWGLVITQGGGLVLHPPISGTVGSGPNPGEGGVRHDSHRPTVGGEGGGHMQHVQHVVYSAASMCHHDSSARARAGTSSFVVDSSIDRTAVVFGRCPESAQGRHPMSAADPGPLRLFQCMTRSHVQLKQSVLLSRAPYGTVCL